MRAQSRFDYLAVARDKAAAGGLSLPRQLAEMTLLMLARGIGPRYYQLARFWRPGIPLATKLAHDSDGQYRRRIAELNPPAYQKISQHKVVEKAVLTLFGLPTPRFLGFHHTLRGRTATGQPLRTAADLEALLAGLEGERVCFKAVEGFGGGGFAALRIERRDGALVLVHPLSGEIRSLADWCRHLERSPDGWLLEEYLPQHPVLAALNPDSLNTLRLWTLRRGDDFVVPGAFLRVGRAGSQVDNTSAGGLACPIDVASGRIAVALDLTLARNEHPRHPDTGAGLVGVTIPHWQRCVELAGAALSAFPHMNFAGLDVAVAPDGPRVIELNVYPDKQGAAHMDFSHAAFFGARR
jgi:hypothetical protein